MINLIALVFVIGFQFMTNDGVNELSVESEGTEKISFFADVTDSYLKVRGNY